MRAALEQSVRETGTDPFSRYLEGVRLPAIKGVALADPQPLGDRQASVRVEYVYQDRNEAQTMYLEKDAAGWKITRVDGTERVQDPHPLWHPRRVAPGARALAPCTRAVAPGAPP